MGKNGAHGLEAGQLALFTQGGSATITAKGVPFRFLLIAGNPIDEPVAWSGPIVMNTREELATAFSDYRHGRFVAQKTDEF